MRTGLRAALFTAFAAAFAAAPLAGQAVQGGPLPAPLPLFPPDSWWNLDVSAAPVDTNSTAFINWIGAGRGLHPDFGGDASTTTPDIYGFPYVVVPGNEPLEVIGAFTYPTESDTGAPGHPPGYPIPVEAKTLPKWIEGGYPGNCDPTLPMPQTSPCRGDRHMLIVDKDNRLLFELYNARCVPYGSPSCSWIAGSGAIFSLDSDQRRTDGWTSADAAGLAILPGLVRYDEVYGAAPIKHAFRFTTHDSNGYVWPASHNAGSNPSAPPMGARLRLKTSTDISGYAAPVQKIFQAMKTYGLILADNGSDMYIQGTYDTRWDNGILNPAFSAIHAGDFEVVQLGWRPAVSRLAGSLSFYTLAPCRAVDTRNPPGAYGAPRIAPGGQRVFTMAGVCGIPPAAKAVSANVTAVNASTAGSFRFFSGDDQPGSPTIISFAAGRTRANNLLLKLSGSGTGTLAVANTAFGPIDLLIDVNGYFQ